MSEHTRSPEVAPATELVVHGLQQWFKKEIGSSTVGRNRYLDDWNDFQSSLLLPYGDYRNVNAAKNTSHYNRLDQWTSDLSAQYTSFDDKQKEYALARQIFCAQMYVSGLFRTQCMMQADNQEDYYHLRLDREYTGVDLPALVSGRIASLFDGGVPEPDNFQGPAIGFSELMHQTRDTNKRQLAYGHDLHSNGRYDVAQQQSRTVETIVDLQERWLNLIVNYIVFTANEHDGQLAAVPFLEPKSISEDPKVYYPFADKAE